MTDYNPVYGITPPEAAKITIDLSIHNLRKEVSRPHQCRGYVMYVLGKIDAVSSIYPRELSFIAARNEANFLAYEYSQRHGGVYA